MYIAPNVLHYMCQIAVPVSSHCQASADSPVLLTLPAFMSYFYPSASSADMSDVVPPEVRPKPVVPAKPPNVGAASPSNPFPAQGLGIGGANPPLPPSGIPVPIGSHGPMHVSSHSVPHGVGHAGGHPAAHNGGHGGGSTLLGYIGIDTIIEQMRKKTMKTGFDFNIMVVGKTEWEMLLGCSCRSPR